MLERKLQLSLKPERLTEDECAELSEINNRLVWEHDEDGEPWLVVLPEDTGPCECWGSNADGHTDADCPQHEG